MLSTLLFPINTLKSFIRYEFKPKKVQSQLGNMVVKDLETFNTNGVVSCAFGLYKLSKKSSKFYRDKTQREHEKCTNDCVVFKGTNCYNDMLDHTLEFKGEAKTPNNKIVKCNLYLLTHKGSGFDGYIVSKILPTRRTTVCLNKNGSGIVS